MSDDNRVLIVARHRKDEIFAILPKGEVVSITHVTIYCDVSFSRVGIDKDDL